MPLVEIQPGRVGRPPLFCVHAGGGNVLSYHELARQLGPEQPVYGLQARGLVAGEEPARRQVAEMADAYLEAVLAARPQGPYLFLGYCFGGLVAYEMGIRLAERGGEAARVVMLDSELRPATDQVPEGAELLIHELGPVITLTPEELAGLDSERQYALAADKLKRAELAPPDYATDDLRRIMAMFQACRYAWRNYRPSIRPADARGRIVLCRARKELAKDGSDPAMGWDRLVGRGLEVLVVPGDHTSMIVRPQVDVLAGYLRPLLR